MSHVPKDFYPDVSMLVAALGSAGIYSEQYEGELFEQVKEHAMAKHRASCMECAAEYEERQREKVRGPETGDAPRNLTGAKQIDEAFEHLQARQKQAQLSLERKQIEELNELRRGHEEARRTLYAAQREAYNMFDKAMGLAPASSQTQNGTKREQPIGFMVFAPDHDGVVKPVSNSFDFEFASVQAKLDSTRASAIAAGIRIKGGVLTGEVRAVYGS